MSFLGRVNIENGSEVDSILLSFKLWILSNFEVSYDCISSSVIFIVFNPLSPSYAYIRILLVMLFVPLVTSSI